MTHKEKRAAVNAVARGIARLGSGPGRLELLEERQLEAVAESIGRELLELYGNGYGPEELGTALDVVRMAGDA